MVNIIHFMLNLFSFRMNDDIYSDDLVPKWGKSGLPSPLAKSFNLGFENANTWKHRAERDFLLQ